MTEPSRSLAVAMLIITILGVFALFSYKALTLKARQDCIHNQCKVYNFIAVKLLSIEQIIERMERNVITHDTKKEWWERE